MAERKKVKDTKGHYIPNLWIDTASGVYYARKEKLGKQALDKSLGAVSLSLAKRLKDQAVSDWLGDDKPGARKGAKLHKFSTYWDEVFIPAKAKKVLAKTVRSYQVAYKTHLEDYFGDKFLEHIDSKMWDEFLEKNPGEEILFNAHKGMNNCLRYAYEVDKIIPGAPKLYLPRERKQRMVGGENEVGYVYERHEVVMAARKAGRGTYLRLAIFLGYKMGLRVGEVCSLRFSKGSKRGEYNYCEFRKDGVVLHLNEVKNKKPRKCFCDPIVARMLIKMRSRRRSEWVMAQLKNPQKPWSTNQLDNKWQKLKGTQGIEYRFHDLRHTFCTWKFKEQDAKFNMALICKYVGMSMKTAEQVYLHLNEYDTRSVVSNRGHDA
jgi:integrase